jgi:hypothetical protein
MTTRASTSVAATFSLLRSANVVSAASSKALAPPALARMSLTMPLAKTELKSLLPIDMFEKSTMTFGVFFPLTFLTFSGTAAMFFSDSAISFSALSPTLKILPMSRSS